MTLDFSLFAFVRVVHLKAAAAGHVSPTYCMFRVKFARVWNVRILSFRIQSSLILCRPLICDACLSKWMKLFKRRGNCLLSKSFPIQTHRLTDRVGGSQVEVSSRQRFTSGGELPACQPVRLSMFEFWYIWTVTTCRKIFSQTWCACDVKNKYLKNMPEKNVKFSIHFVLKCLNFQLAS